jgi:hypothetical protein
MLGCCDGLWRKSEDAESKSALNDEAFRKKVEAFLDQSKL